MSYIEHYDGNSGELLSKERFEDVPAEHREVQRNGRLVPVARVVKSSFDAEGARVPRDQAVRVLIEEFDAEGKLLRATEMVRS